MNTKLLLLALLCGVALAAENATKTGDKKAPAKNATKTGDKNATKAPAKNAPAKNATKTSDKNATKAPAKNAPANGGVSKCCTCTDPKNATKTGDKKAPAKKAPAKKGSKKLTMKPKLDAAAKAKAKKAGKDKAAVYKRAKASKKAADANMTKAEKATATADKKKKKDTWTAKKKKKFKGKMTLTGIDFTKTDNKTKSAKAAFEEATIAELDLTEEDEITFTYVKKAARRRLLAAGTTVSYEITVAEDAAVALEAKLTEDPEGTAILAMANAISTDFPEAVTAEVVSETVDDVAADTTPELNGAAAVTVTWAAGAASVVACLALW